MQKSKTQRGFSMVELLVVLTVISIIAVIAIPNLLSSRRAANEASAISAQRTIASSEATYFATTGSNRNYGSAQDLFDGNLIDATLAAAHGANTSFVIGSVPKNGYTFILNVVDAEESTGTPANYIDTAQPAIASGATATGTRAFCVMEDGVVRSMPLDSLEPPALGDTGPREQCAQMNPVN